MNMDTNEGRRDFLIGASAATLSGTLLGKSAAAQEPVAPEPLRILVLNPNSSPEFTEIIAREARLVGGPGTEFVEATAFFGPRYIGSRATVAIAGHAAVDALARILAKDPNFDAAILAGFGAQGVPAMREIAPFPVVGMLEASVSAAMQLGSRFSILTGGDRWVPMLEEQLYAQGLSSRVASVRAIPLTGAEIAADQDRALSLLAELSETCVREDRAECVILGGAAVAGLARRIADRVSVPLLDSVATSVATAEMLARVATTPKASRTRPPAIESVGLSDELSTVLEQQ
jgi:allantoin racemase